MKSSITRLTSGCARGYFHSHVMMWSNGESVTVLIIEIGQVLVLRSFFTEKKISELPVRISLCSNIALQFNSITNIKMSATEVFILTHLTENVRSW